MGPTGCVLGAAPAAVPAPVKTSEPQHGSGVGVSPKGGDTRGSVPSGFSRRRSQWDMHKLLECHHLVTGGWLLLGQEVCPLSGSMLSGVGWE